MRQAQIGAGSTRELVADDECGMAGRLGRMGADQIRQDYGVSHENVFAGHLSFQKQ